MSSITKNRNSKFWLAKYKDETGKWTTRSTKVLHSPRDAHETKSNEYEAAEIAKQFERECFEKRQQRSVIKEPLAKLFEKIYKEDGFQIYTVGQVFEMYLKRELKESTRKIYDGIKNQLDRIIGLDNRIIQVSAQDGLKYLEERLRQVSSASVEREIAVLCAVWRYAIDRGYATRNVFKLTKTDHLKVKKDKWRAAFTLEQIETIIRTSQNQEQLLYVLLYYTAGRISDILNLSWQNIDLDRKIISFIPKKTKDSVGEPVRIPISCTVADFLKAYKEQHPFVIFSNYADGEAGCRKAGRDLAKALIRAGIAVDTSRGDGRYNRRNLTIHSFRRSHITIAEAAGINPSLSMAVSGHRTVTMHQHYVRPSDDQLASAYSALPAVSF